MNEFFSAIDKIGFPVSIDEFIGLLGLLPDDTQIWYTHTLRTYHLVPVYMFLGLMPDHSVSVNRRDEVGLKVLPNTFSNPAFFIIHTTSEGVCLFAIDRGSAASV